MTEINRNIEGLDEYGRSVQVLVDEYHPRYPAIKSAEEFKIPSKSGYLEALARRDREILAGDPHAILPHHPCG